MDNIRPAASKDIHSIADYQVKMADEIYSLKLDRKLVEDAVQYLLNHKQYGHFIICTNAQNLPCGCLLITYENSKNWWIQSVYVTIQQRKKGNFTRLYYAAIKAAKQNGAVNLSLYVNEQNHKAKEVYKRLGMKGLGLKLFGADLTYGEGQILQLLKSEAQDNLYIKKEITNQANLEDLSKIFGYLNNNPKLFVFRKQSQELLGYCEYFSQFSDWRFGLTLYINVFYSKSDNQKQILNQIIKYIYKDSSLNVGAIRLLLTKQQITKIATICPRMHEEEDEVFMISL